MNQATANAAHLFLQLTVILGVCRICGLSLRRLGQAPVVGEMVAGVLLGPSLLGAVAPELSEWLFPKSSRPVLFAIAQLGLTFYMFTIGLEFSTKILQTHWRKAMMVSTAGILGPFILGGILAVWLVRQGGFFSGEISTGFAILFMGAAMSITAFPMLARIISEQGLTKTSMGTIGLAAGSVDDVVAWILLAAVLGGVSGSQELLLIALGGGVVYALVCLKIMRPLWVWLERRCTTQTMLGIIAVMVMFAGWFTDMIGIYSVFGAFILGLSVPRNGLAEKAKANIEPLTSAFLLPVFFAYSGLQTRIGLVDSGMLWLICILIVLVAVGGKLGACYAAARLSGSNKSDALTIAALMNARGLMELILLNIALEAGVISDTLFTMLVVMAVVTTLMAAPGFHVARRLAANGC